KKGALAILTEDLALERREKEAEYRQLEGKKLEELSPKEKLQLETKAKDMVDLDRRDKEVGDFVETHFGKKNKLASNHGVPRIWPLVKEKTAELRKAGKIHSDRKEDDIEMAGLLLKTSDSKGLMAEFETWCSYPAEKFPAVWAKLANFIDRFGRS